MGMGTKLFWEFIREWEWILCISNMGSRSCGKVRSHFPIPIPIEQIQAYCVIFLLFMDKLCLCKSLFHLGPYLFSPPDSGEALSWGIGDSGRLGHNHDSGILGFFKSTRLNFHSFFLSFFLGNTASQYYVIEKSKKERYKKNSSNREVLLYMAYVLLLFSLNSLMMLCFN